MNVLLSTRIKPVLSSGAFTFFRDGCVVALAAVLLATVLTGCGTSKVQRVAPTEGRQPMTDSRSSSTPTTPGKAQTTRGETPSIAATGKTHTVRQGETLYSIALQNEVDYRELADWNGITDVSKLDAGQVLLLESPTGEQTAATEPTVTTAPLQTVPPVPSDSGQSMTTTEAVTATTTTATEGDEQIKTSPKAEKYPYSEQTLVAMNNRVPENTAGTTPSAVPPVENTVSIPPQTTPPASIGGIEWSWPTQGKVVSTYSDKASLKGIDIVGSIGQPVVASATGRVVYVGSGLRGYGKLVIVKHNDTFLSVYAHNRELLVNQGQQVNRGEKIAEMGNTDTDQVKLHFEIRRDGKPVDPIQYLPER